jgi:hypothetical protein
VRPIYVAAGCSVALVVRDARAEDDVARADRWRARSGAALAARASMPVDDSLPDRRGVRAHAALAIGGPFALGLAASFERDGVGPRNRRPPGYTLNLATSTAVLSLGAPWTRNVWGVSLEGGFAYGSRRSDAADLGTFVATYARGALHVQAPIGDLRPWISLGHSTMWITAGVPSLATSIEIGFAFDR